MISSRQVHVQSDLSVGTDQDGLQEVTGAPGVLALPHQVSRGVVAPTTG